MKKMLFTPEGVQSKQKEINALSIEERLKISEHVANNPVEFISDNFEMSEEQQSYLKELELVDIRITGFSLAIALLAQAPIEMQDTTPPSAFASRGKKKKKLSINASAGYDPVTGSTTVIAPTSITWSW